MSATQLSVKNHSKSSEHSKVIRLHRSAPQAPTTGDRDRDIFAIARRLASDCRLVAGGAELFAEGERSDNLYVVLDGWLFLHRILEDGRRQILDFALPGGVLGYRAHADTPFSFTVEALTDAKVAVIPLSRLKDLLLRGSGCAVALLDAAHESLLEAFDNLTDLGRRTAREAVAHFLLRMDRRIRRTGVRSDDAVMPFPLTQEHMGDALGLTAVHVCRTLRALRADGLVEAGRGRFKILDREALAAEAGIFLDDPYDTRLAS